jgi:hypothetical protein
MTIQRITNLHSAPISACLRAFVLAAETGISLNSRPNGRSCSVIAKVGSKLGMSPVTMFTGGNAYGTKVTQGNSALLRGSA